MIQHILKLIWNRKASNALIIAEVAIAFIVVFSLLALAIRNFNLYQVPLGYDYKDRWRVQASIPGEWDAERDLVTINQLRAALSNLPQVNNVHLLRNPTFKDWAWTSSYDLGDQTISYMGNHIDDGAAENFGMKLLAGRWFGPQDAAQNYTAVLVSNLFVERYFPEQDIIGKNIASDEGEQQLNHRVVGVFEQFRQLGEFSPMIPYTIFRYDLNSKESRHMAGIEIKVNAGTSIQFEEVLMKQLTSIAPNWEFSIRPWEDSRRSQTRGALLPLIVLSIIGGFLILMVAMGLFGVLWQNVTSRTQEIGLRRAIGATANQIQRQVMLELLIVNAIGIICASVLLVQLPLLGVFSELNWSLFAISMLLASVFMLVLSAACAYYPGIVATSLAPAQALHYE
ncbi:MAG: ABC transporter permease [Kangiellaceae bacterium]|nr:ABC transporter permease [Kangiellaceae bacterium]